LYLFFIARRTMRVRNSLAPHFKTELFSGFQDGPGEVNDFTPMARILHVITGLRTGGAEMMLWKFLSLSRTHHSQAVLSLMDEGSIGPRIDRLKVPVYTLNLRKTAPNPARALDIRSLTRQFDPDLILGWMYHANLVASFAGLVSPRRTPVFWGVRHGLEDEQLRRRPIVKLGALFSRQPDAIIYNSTIGAQQHAAFGFHTAQPIVIPNGFDCQTFRPDPEARYEVLKELNLEEDTVLVGLVARYDPLKDHAGFLEAVAVVAKNHPSPRFILVGQGTQEPELEKLVSNLDLRDRVFLLGERPDIPRLTAALDIACSSSREEGFSNAIGEAMSCGVACVVTDVGDSRYLVGETGLCVPPSQPDALAGAIGRLISAGPECRQKLGVAARRRVEENFSLPAVVGRFEKVFDQYLHQRNGHQPQSVLESS
jgi:glycosyltransferase involved in cell wall biosynthesis